MDAAQGAINEAEESARGLTGDIAAKLADRVGNRAGVKAIFGEPVERDGVTVIPVGRTRWGFGGGGGKGGRADEEGEGSGGGGGAIAVPVGYIEISGGAARFRRIGLPVSPGTLIAAAAGLYLVMRGLRAMRR